MVWMYTSCSIANIITTTVNQLCLNNADVINQVVYESHNLCHSPLTRTKLIHVALIYKWVLPFDINYDSTNKIYRSIDQIIPKLTYLTISILMYLPAYICNTTWCIHSYHMKITFAMMFRMFPWWSLIWPHILPRIWWWFCDSHYAIIFHVNLFIDTTYFQLKITCYKEYFNRWTRRSFVYNYTWPK
jgi:hypothetical protein